MTAVPLATFTTNNGKVVEVYDYDSDDDVCSSEDCNCDFLCEHCETDIGEYECDAYYYENDGNYYCKDCYEMIVNNS